MKAIVNTLAGKLEWQELPRPQPPAGWVRIRTAACGICATDLEMIAGWERTGFPAIPGHEWCGWVDLVGDRDHAGLEGAFCVAENVLSDGGEVGFEHGGGYAEYFLTEADNVHPLPRDFPAEIATLIEPLAVVLRGVNRLEPRADKPTLIIGDGPIGLLTAAILKQRGIGPLTLVGGRRARLDQARRFGVDTTIDYHDLGEPMAAGLRARTGGGFQQLIEASGSPAAIAAAVDSEGSALPQARVLVLGDYGSARAGFAWNDLLHRELTIIGSNASAGAWPAAVELATSNPALLAPLVTHRLPANRFAEGIALMQQQNPEVVKIILDWQLSAASCQLSDN